MPDCVLVRCVLRQRRCKRDVSLAKAGDAAPAVQALLASLCVLCMPRRAARCIVRALLDTRMAPVAWCAVACMRMRRMDARARTDGRVVQASSQRQPRCACPPRLLPRPRPTPPRRAQRTPSPATPRPAAGHRPHAAPFHAPSFSVLSSRQSPCHWQRELRDCRRPDRAVR